MKIEPAIKQPMRGWSKSYLEHQRVTVFIKHITYALSRWTALARYAQDPRLPIDNNRAENTIRPIAVGRKNWLFAGSPQASQRAAMIMSLLETARLNGIDPYQWLHSMLTHLPQWPNS